MSAAARYTGSVLQCDELGVRLGRIRDEGSGLEAELSSLHGLWSEWLTAVEGAQEVLRNAGDGTSERSRGRAPLTSASPLLSEAPPPPAVEAAGSAADETPAGADAVAPNDVPGNEPSSDDEQLLATLDAETANAIRVKRRMDGNRRSVREWLAEIRAAKASPRSEGKKSGWWS